MWSTPGAMVVPSHASIYICPYVNVGEVYIGTFGIGSILEKSFTLVIKDLDVFLAYLQYILVSREYPL